MKCNWEKKLEKGKWWKKSLRCWLQWRQGQWWNEWVVWKLLVSSWARDSTWPPDQTSGFVFYLAAMVWGLMLPGSTCEVMSAPVVIHLANSATLSWRMPPISYPYVHCWKQSAKNNSAMSHLSSRKPIYLTLPWPGYVCKCYAMEVQLVACTCSIIVSGGYGGGGHGGQMSSENRHPRCSFSRKYRHPDAHIYVNMGIQVSIFTVNMGIPPWK